MRAPSSFPTTSNLACSRFILARAIQLTHKHAGGGPLPAARLGEGAPGRRLFSWAQLIWPGAVAVARRLTFASAPGLWKLVWNRIKWMRRAPHEYRRLRWARAWGQIGGPKLMDRVRCTCLGSLPRRGHPSGAALPPRRRQQQRRPRPRPRPRRPRPRRQSSPAEARARHQMGAPATEFGKARDQSNQSLVGPKC